MSTDPLGDFHPSGVHASSELLPQKLGHTTVNLSRRERIQWWARAVWFELFCTARAVVQMPPREISRPVVLNPRDPGYDDPCNLIIVKHATFYPWALTRACPNPMTPDEVEKMGKGEKP